MRFRILSKGINKYIVSGQKIMQTNTNNTAPTNAGSGRLDPLSPDDRSERMRRIRNKDSKPELLVRRLVHSLGYRYRLHRKDLPGTPDLVFSSRRKVIFVHGCFWHRHRGCSMARMPKSRQDFWIAKLNGNRVRDVRNQLLLRHAGWDVCVVWECETLSGNLDALSQELTSFLESDA